MKNLDDSGTWLESEYCPVAAYFPDSDCVEYVAEDTLCVYERIDSFLTLIWDETKFRTIGFKLKGFRWVFEHRLRSHYRLNEGAFVKLVAAIEAVCSQIGDDLFVDDRRSRAYVAARKIAARDDVVVADPELRLAA